MMTVPFPYRLHNVRMNDQIVPRCVDLEWQQYAIRKIFPGCAHVHPHMYISEFAVWLRKRNNLHAATSQLVADVENLNDGSMVRYNFSV